MICTTSGSSRCVFPPVPDFMLNFWKLCKKVTKEQELKLNQNRKKFDIREEYFVRFYFAVKLGWCSFCFVEVERGGQRGLGAKEDSAAEGLARVGCSPYGAFPAPTIGFLGISLSMFGQMA